MVALSNNGGVLPYSTGQPHNSLPTGGNGYFQLRIAHAVHSPRLLGYGVPLQWMTQHCSCAQTAGRFVSV